MSKLKDLYKWLTGQAQESAKTQSERKPTATKGSSRGSSRKTSSSSSSSSSSGSTSSFSSGSKKTTKKTTKKEDKKEDKKKPSEQQKRIQERQKELAKKRKEATEKRRKERTEATKKARENYQEAVKKAVGDIKEVKPKLKPDEREYTGSNAKSMEAMRGKNKKKRDAAPKAQQEIAERPAVLGFYNAANPLPFDIDEHFATKEARETAKKSKDSKAYDISYGVTTAGSFLAGAGGGNAVARNILKNTAKKGGKATVKKGTKNLAKAGGKKVTKPKSVPKVKDVPKNTKTQKFVADRVGDFAGSTPLNVKEAVKSGRQEDGSFDEKEALKSFATNTALDFAVGGALDGVIAGAKVLKTKADANKYIKIKAKKDAGGKLTDKELAFYNKATGELQSDMINGRTAPKAESAETPTKDTETPTKDTETPTEIDTVKGVDNAQSTTPTNEAGEVVGQPKVTEQPKTAQDFTDEVKAKRKAENDELQALRKEKETLGYKIQNTKNDDHYREYVKRKMEIEDRMEAIYESRGLKNVARPTKEVAQKAEDLTQAAKGEYAESLAELTRGSAKNWDTFKRVFVDTFSGFEKYANTLPKEVRETFRAQVNSMRNAKNKAGGWLSEARISADGKKLGKSFKHIMGDMLQPKNAQKYEDFQYYLANKHNIDRFAKGKGVFGDTITSKDSKDICKALEKQYPDFKGLQGEVLDYFKDLQQFRVDTGLISKETADYLDAIYPNYTPTYRVVNGERVNIVGQGGNTVSAGTPIKFAKGSDAEIMPLHMQVANLTEYTMKLGEQNRLFNMLATTQGLDVKAIDPSVKLEDAIEACTFTSKVTEGTTNKFYVSFYDQGKLKKMQISDQMYHGIREWRKDPDSLAAMFNWRAKTVRGVNNTFKNLITGWNPIFGVKNIVKDTGEALIYTKDVKGFISAYPKAIKSILGKNEYFKLYQASGGKYAHIRDDIATFDIEKSWKKVAKTPIELCQRFNDTLEAIPRMAEFISTIDKSLDAKAIYKAGGSVEDVLSKMDSKTINKAMMNANEVTLNFGRSGVGGKLLNSTLVPYLNPAIQGVDKLARVFADAGRDGTKGVLDLAIKLTALGLAPVAVNEILNMNNEHYQTLNARDQDNNFMIYMGDGKFFKVPKSRVVGALSAPMTHVMRYAEYGDSIEWKEMFKGMWSNVGVMNPLDSNLFSPIMLMANNKTWYGGNIENAKDLNLRTADKTSEIYDETTSAVGIWIADKIKFTNISPKQVDYIIDAYTGVIGDFLLPATAEASSNNPLYKNFILDSVFSNKLATEFWNENADLEARSNVNGGKDAEAYEEWQATYMYDANTLNKAITDIDSDENLTKAEKLAMKRELRKALNQFYKGGKERTTVNIEPVSTIAKQIGADKALSNYLPDNKKKKYSFKEYYKEFKRLSDYSNKGASQKDKIANEFLSSYKLSVETQKKISAQYHNTPSWDTLAIVNTHLGNSENFTKACGVYDSSVEVAKNYLEKMGGSIGKYINTQKQINKQSDTLKRKGIDTDDSLYKRNLKSGASALALAKAKTIFYDRAYYVSRTSDKMNAARGLEKKYDWTTKEVMDLGLSADADGNTYLKKDEVVNAIENSKAKDTEEKAMLFNLIMGSDTNNPYGSIGDYSLKDDTGIPTESSSSSSYGGYRRSYSRGSSGGSKGSDITWEEYVAEIFGDKKSKTTTIKSRGSELNEAYRKKVGKLVDNMRV